MMYRSVLLLLATFLLLQAVSAFPKAQQVIPLEKYTIEDGSLTVSGISAGGAMATQFHVAYSKNVRGAGIFAGLAYGCAKGTLAGALNCMNSPFLTNVNSLITRTEGYEKDGSIDSTTFLADDKVYVFHGTKDTVVANGNGNQIVTYYENFMPSASIKTEFSLAAEHCQPTDNFGTVCSKLNSDNYINDCDYKGAFEMLNHLYDGKLKEGGTAVAGNLYQFDQSEFFARPASASMDTEGYVYIPSDCKDPTRLCKLHVALHGCQQGSYKIGDVYVQNAGYLEVAEQNAIIVLFPQAVSTLGSNPNGCFDWWGYNDKFYETKNGEQMDGIWQMVLKLGLVPVV